jgi:hypothetical protein
MVLLLPPRLRGLRRRDGGVYGSTVTAIVNCPIWKLPAPAFTIRERTEGFAGAGANLATALKTSPRLRSAA